MSQPSVKYIEPKRETKFGSWSRKVEVDGKLYWVGVDKGSRVRIAFKPRGPEGWGFHWHGYVRDEKGKYLWKGQVNKSTGARGLLTYAGILPKPTKLTSLERKLVEDMKARRAQITDPIERIAFDNGSDGGDVILHYIAALESPDRKKST